MKRTRACIEATASLVCCANAKLAWFEGLLKLLGDIGSFEKIRELSLAGTDELFVMRWTCLSLVAIRSVLSDNDPVDRCAEATIEELAKLAKEVGFIVNNDALATATALRIDEAIRKAKDCLDQSYRAFRLYDAVNLTEEQVKEILSGCESQISGLEQINIEAEHLHVDDTIENVADSFNRDSHQIISQIPGVFDIDFDLELPPFSHFLELSGKPHNLQFIYPRQILMSMCSTALTLCNILEGQWDADAYKESLKNLKILNFGINWKGGEMRRQLWRLQDLRDGGGFGFTVELFFLALGQLLYTSSSKESHSALYTGTFRVITSEWSKHKHSIGTQNLLLDIAMSRLNRYDSDFPAYIVDEFSLLLRRIFEGQTGPHIGEARQRFDSVEWSSHDSERIREIVLSILTLGQAQSLAS